MKKQYVLILLIAVFMNAKAHLPKWKNRAAEYGFIVRCGCFRVFCTFNSDFFHGKVILWDCPLSSLPCLSEVFMCIPNFHPYHLQTLIIIWFTAGEHSTIPWLSVPTSSSNPKRICEGPPRFLLIPKLNGNSSMAHLDLSYVALCALQMVQYYSVRKAESIDRSHSEACGRN